MGCASRDQDSTGRSRTPPTRDEEAAHQQKRLAELMHTSRADVDRILDADIRNVTFEMLYRATALVGRQLRFELV